METKIFDVNDTSDENLNRALRLHNIYSNEVTERKGIRKILDVEDTRSDKELADLQQAVQKYLQDYFDYMDTASVQAVVTMKHLLTERAFEELKLDDDGKTVEIEKIDLGLKFIHDEFNGGCLLPLQTSMVLVAGSGVGKSDYLYKIADTLLFKDYKVLLCSFEFGKQRLSKVCDLVENGGKNSLPLAIKNNKTENLFVNFNARTVKDIKLLIDTQVKNGVKIILIDSFGEFFSENEYMLQKELSIVLNALSNQYGIFIALIVQTKVGALDGDYSVRGGNDVIYKADFAIHLSKLAPEDTSGLRKIHLIKNRDADINGKTIITEYDFEKREPKFKCLASGYNVDKNGKQFRSLSFKSSK